MMSRLCITSFQKQNVCFFSSRIIKKFTVDTLLAHLVEQADCVDPQQWFRVKFSLQPFAACPHPLSPLFPVTLSCPVKKRLKSPPNNNKKFNKYTKKQFYFMHVLYGAHLAIYDNPSLSLILKVDVEQSDSGKQICSVFGKIWKVICSGILLYKLWIGRIKITVYLIDYSKLPEVPR